MRRSTVLSLPLLPVFPASLTFPVKAGAYLCGAPNSYKFLWPFLQMLDLAKMASQGQGKHPSLLSGTKESV
jgi:hypothetical protein